MRVYVIALCCLLGLWSCQSSEPEDAPAMPSPETPITIYHGGTILTMVDDRMQVEALAFKDGVIFATGSLGKVQKAAGEDAVEVNLRGKTLMPGFIDAHGHFLTYGVTTQMVPLLADPYGKGNDLEAIKGALKSGLSDKVSDVLLGFGYDDAAMKEHQHPTRAMLDSVSSERAIYVIHNSGHMGVANSKALEMIGYDENTESPPGGQIVKGDDGELTGLLTEAAHFAALMKLSPDMGQELKEKAISTAQEEWMKYGQTTICEGRATSGIIDILEMADSLRWLKDDVVVLVDYDGNKEWIVKNAERFGQYEGALKFQAVKFTLDGSPQGRTALLSSPYMTVPEGEQSDYRGIRMYDTDTLKSYVGEICDFGLPMHFHTNGDGAIQQLIDVLSALKEEGRYSVDMAPVLVHSQIMKPGQLQKVKELGLIPSFFVGHTYLFGDWYQEVVLGPERTSWVSPVGDAVAMGMTFTLSHDAPVTPPDVLFMVWAATQRKSRQGRVINEGQRISALDALKAVTIYAAKAYGEAETKGTLEPKKLADMVILDKNPLAVDTDEIRNIKVLETIKGGKSAYKRPLD